VVIEGRFAVSRALQCGYRPDLILTTKETLASLPDPPLETVVEVLSRVELSGISGYDFHRGCLALGERPRRVRTLDSVIHQITSITDDPKCRTVLLLERIADPQNVGAILRTAHALGVSHIFVSSECANPWSRRVIRTSMANVFATPPIISADLCDVADRLCQEAKAQLIAAALTDDAVPIQDFRHTEGPIALMLGNEGAGLSSALVERAHHVVKIPVQDAADSLNVAVAAGIFLDRLRQPLLDAFDSA